MSSYYCAPSQYHIAKGCLFWAVKSEGQYIPFRIHGECVIIYMYGNEVFYRIGGVLKVFSLAAFKYRHDKKANASIANHKILEHVQ